MFHFITSVSSYFKNLLFQLMYVLGLYSIRFYLYIKESFNNNDRKENFEYIATYHHSHNEITEYEIKYKNNVHKLKFIGDDFNKFTQENNMEETMENKNKILHCCLVNKEGDLIFDCTDELRTFRYYFTNTNTMTWKIFFDHILSIHLKPINLHECILLLCKNDEHLSEINFILNEFNLNNYIII